MKKLSKILLFSMLFVCIAGINQAWATILDLGTVSSGSINGAYFEALDASQAGRGVFPTFLAIQEHGTSQGYNSDYRGEGYPEFDETTSLIHNHSVELAWVGQIQLDGAWYYSFGLDADQAPGGDPLIFLEELEIYQTDDPEAHGYPSGLGDLVYDLDAGGDNAVWLDYTLSSGGSGQTDMIVSVPVSCFSYPGEYVVLYSLFSNDNDGPQEWSYMAGEGAPPVPEPATMLLLGSGLLGLAGLRRKFRK